MEYILCVKRKKKIIFPKNEKTDKKLTGTLITFCNFLIQVSFCIQRIKLASVEYKVLIPSLAWPRVYMGYVWIRYSCMFGFFKLW